LKAKKPAEILYRIQEMLPHFQPMPVGRSPRPFSHPDWIYEIKWDGFRSLAYLEDGHCRLISRNGNEF